jgi:hypothetical protein
MGYGSEGPKPKKGTGKMENKRNLYGKSRREFEFDEIDVAELGKACKFAIQEGSAFMVTYAPSSGVASVRLFEGDSKEVGYAKDAQEFNALVQETLAHFNPET